MIDFPLRTDIVKGIDHSYYYQVLHNFLRQKNYKSLPKGFLLLFVSTSCSGVHYICVLNTVHFSRASKKHQFS